jgi:hypothetical protein
MKLCATHCNTSWIVSLILLAFGSYKVSNWWLHLEYATLQKWKKKGLRYHKILAASLIHETMRLDNEETFHTNCPYSFVQYVMWCHLVTATLSHIPCQTPMHVLCTHGLENFSTPHTIVYYSTQKFQSFCQALYCPSVKLNIQSSTDIQNVHRCKYF